MRRTRSEAPLVAAARRAGVTDRRLLDAVAAVPRDRFVPPEDRRSSTRDRPVPIGLGQTTSQPSLIALMIDALALTGSETVLEIGTGFGYQAAVLSHLAAQVVTVERHEALAAQARQNLDACGLDNVEVVVADGTRGWPPRAPYDAIVIAAAADEIPAALGAQLVDGGRLVAPVGPQGEQEVRLYLAADGDLRLERRLTAVRFVPLVADPHPDAGTERPPEPDGEPDVDPRVGRGVEPGVDPEGDG